MPANLKHLVAHLLENGFIAAIDAYDPAHLSIMTRDVLARIQAGDPSWEAMVPAITAKTIKRLGLFGWVATP